MFECNIQHILHKELQGQSHVLPVDKTRGSDRLTAETSTQQTEPCNINSTPLQQMHLRHTQVHTLFCLFASTMDEVTKWSLLCKTTKCRKQTTTADRAKIYSHTLQWRIQLLYRPHTRIGKYRDIFENIENIRYFRGRKYQIYITDIYHANPASHPCPHECLSWPRIANVSVSLEKKSIN